MKRRIKYIAIIIILSFPTIWSAAVLRCEILTYLHGNEFEAVYIANQMIGHIDYLKVLKYSSSSAHVYYVSSNKSLGNIFTFTKDNGGWVYKSWDTIWSKTGSADSFIWPYIR